LSTASATALGFRPIEEFDAAQQTWPRGDRPDDLDAAHAH